MRRRLSSWKEDAADAPLGRLSAPDRLRWGVGREMPLEDAMNADSLDDILSSLNPATLEALVRGLAARQGEGNRSGVSLPDIMEALTGGGDLGTGSVGWRRHLRLKQAIIDAVAGIAGMQYVEGDA